VKDFAFRMANKLYKNFYPAYYPLYVAWKAISDRRERRLLDALVKPGMTVVDVGANVGVYTRYLAGLVGKSGRVHAFEPSPANFHRLQGHVAHLPNVLQHQAAVGNRSGSTLLYMSEAMNVDHHTYDAGDGRKGIEVPIVSLDDYFKQGERVDLVKIDVQGHEMNVLEGAKRVLVENPAMAVLMEFWPYGLAMGSADAGALLTFIDSLDFQIRRTTDPTGCRFDAADLEVGKIDHYCNLLLTRKGRVDG
jgi:FkbM family methyltransferase